MATAFVEDLLVHCTVVVGWTDTDVLLARKASHVTTVIGFD